jgi:hypothetical protein
MRVDYRNMAIRFAGALWTYCDVCPECGNKKEQHMPSCKKGYEELTNPRDAEKVFKKVFEGT